MRRKVLAILTISALITIPIVYALVSANQSIKYTISPSSSITAVTENLGTVHGGISGSQYFTQAVTVMTTLSGSHTLSLHLNANSSDWQSLTVGIGDCTLTLASPSCSQTITGPVTQIYDESVAYTPMDGVSHSSSILVGVIFS